MMRWIVLVIVLLFPNVGMADNMEVIRKQASECRKELLRIGLNWTTPPWNCRDVPAETLSQALKYELEFLGPDNVGYSMGSNGHACQALINAGLKTCNYNVRGVLVGFLAMYGVNLFPSEDPEWDIAPGSNSYAGQGDKNLVLIKSIKRNAKLLADGDLTADEVSRWQ